MGNRPIDVDQNNIMSNFAKTDDILKDMCGIIEATQKAAYQAVNTVFIHFIRLILRFSRHCLENLRGCYRGHIMRCYCR